MNVPPGAEETPKQWWMRVLPLFLRDRLEGRLGLQKAISNTGWLLADRIVRMGVGLLVNVWVARYLGPEQFGVFSFAGAFVALFSAVATLGLDSIVIRDLVKDPLPKERILGTAFFLKAAGGAACFFLAVGGIALLRPGDPITQLLVTITAAGMIFQALDAVDFWFQSRVLSRFTVWAKSAAFLVAAVIKVILIMGKAPLVAFAWVGLAEVAMGAVGLALVYRASGNPLKGWSFDRSLAGRLLRDSWPLIMSGIVIMIYMRIDQVMLGEMAGDREVGIYSAAVRIAEAWYFIPGAVVNSVFPSVIEARARDEGLFYRRLQRLYNLMALVAYMVAVPVTFASGWIMETLYGSEYAAAGSLLAVLVWAGLFTGLGIARSSFLTAMNWTRVHFLTVFLGAMINVGLNFVLIPRYGAMGAAIASCIAYWIAAHGACFLYPPLFRTGWMLTKAILWPKFW